MAALNNPMQIHNLKKLNQIEVVAQILYETPFLSHYTEARVVRIAVKFTERSGRSLPTTVKTLLAAGVVTISLPKTSDVSSSSLCRFRLAKEEFILKKVT